MPNNIYELEYETNIEAAITWQYEEKATALQTLIKGEQKFFEDNVQNFWKDWKRDVFNVETATRFGLIVWAKIFNCTNYVEMTRNISTKTFGFGPNHRNFYFSNFGISSYILSLPTEDLRKVIKAQMLLFNSNGSMASINEIITTIFPNHNAYASYDKTTNVISYNFPVPLNDNDLSLVLFSNILPVPVGCKRLINNGESE